MAKQNCEYRIIEPATKEAELFHEIDMLSSRLGRLSVEELERV